MTECILEQLEFQGLGGRRVVGRFDGGRMSTDGGAMLLREADGRVGLTERLAGCFRDHRNAGRIEHTVQELVGQRVMGIALGYEDLNDHNLLRDDSVVALAVGREDLSGSGRLRERDRGHAMAGASTLNRLELSVPGEAGEDRYKRVEADFEAMDRLMVGMFVEAQEEKPEEVWLDVDATDDELHGEQEGRFFHGYYDSYCYLPLYITSGKHVLSARLRPSNVDASAGAVEELKRVVGQLREAWPEVRVVIRGDSGFCREEIMGWCEGNGVDYVLGLARNARLEGKLGRALCKSRRRQMATGKASRRYREWRYRTRKTWSRSRRVVGKAEWLTGARGANPRFVVTSLKRSRAGKRMLYEELYCARGDMENRIREHQYDLFAERTSSGTLRANQLRLYFAVFAGVLMETLRREGLRGTELAEAQYRTLRTRLLKVAVSLRITVRRVWLSFPSAWPWQGVFAQSLARLRAAPA